MIEMPEGPSIILLKEAVAPFTGKKIAAVTGNTKIIDTSRLLNRKVKAFKSWGKHFLICFQGFTVRIHFLLFGSYLINEKRNSVERLGLIFSNGEINFYACSVRILEGDLEGYYDWSLDVMNDEWNAHDAEKRLKKFPEMLICDALLDQNLFAGVGNIIKNEILYRVRIHPESIVKKLKSTKTRRLVKETRIYSYQFLKWKRIFVLKKHWLVHTRKICNRCGGSITKKYTGLKKRRSFFCMQCQHLYT